MNKINLKQSWDQIITHKKGWLDFNLKEIWKYRDLFKIYIHRNIVTQYKQTILGPLWILIPPVLTTLVFTVIFGNIAQISTDGLPKPLFYMAGIVTWGYFSNVLSSTSNSLTGNMSIYGKVYFPRLIIPLSMLISSLIRYFVQLFLFGAMIFYYNFSNPNILQIKIHLLIFLPIIIIIMGLQGLGFGLLFSAITSKYRDFRFLISFGLRLLMYASPVVFPLSIVSDKYKNIILANPMTVIIESFRYMVFGVGEVSLNAILYSIIFTIMIFLFGCLIFNYIEKDFIDSA